MPSKDQNTTDQTTPESDSSTVKYVVAGLVIVAITYIGFVSPTRKHMAALERQCRELSRVVKQLQGQETSTGKGLRIIELLESQGDKLTSASRSLDNLISLRKRIVEESKALSEMTTTIEDLENVKRRVADHGKKLEQMSQTLDEMAHVASAIVHSNEVVLQAKDSMESLARHQSEVMNDILAVSEQLTVLEDKVITRENKLPQAEQTLGQIDELCQQLASESASVAAARIHLAGLAGLKNEVIEHSANIPEASQLLGNLMELRDRILRSGETIAAAQRMVVDVILMEPAMERAVAVLQPMTDYHRLTQHEPNQAPKTEETSSTWTEVLKVAFTMLMPLG